MSGVWPLCNLLLEAPAKAASPVVIIGLGWFGVLTYSR